MEKRTCPVKKLTVNGADIGGFVISCDCAAGGVIPYAAEELQRYIASAVGVTLPISHAPVAVGTKRIAVSDLPSAPKDSFRYFTDEDGITLCGSSRRGALYAVYRFLEECIGWRFFAADTEICKSSPEIDLSDLNFAMDMCFEIRDIYWTEYFEKGISVKRYQNGDGKRCMGNDVHLGGHEILSKNGIHNIGALTKTGDGFSPNPCLNCEENYQNALQSLLAYLSAHPDEKRLHVSQNDRDAHCACEKCTADEEYYGSAAGTLVKFVNRLCTDLGERGYPDVKLVTFAYRYTFPCPRNIVCHPNVIIELCTIDYCYNHAFNDPACPRNAALMPEIEKWSDICGEFFIWDYTVNFKYYLAPFPNFHVLRENMKVMSEIGGMGLLEQGNYQTPSGEFGALRCYLLAKLMEDPAMSEEAYDIHMNDFLEGYYGPGWRYIRRFIDLITTLAKDKNVCFGIYSSPEEIYGDHAFAPYSDTLKEWWSNALAMAETEVQKGHILQSRICSEYLRLGAVHGDSLKSGDESKIQAVLGETEALYRDCMEFGIGRIAENCPLPDSVDPKVNPRAWWELHRYCD